MTISMKSAVFAISTLDLAKLINKRVLRAVSMRRGMCRISHRRIHFNQTIVVQALNTLYTPSRMLFPFPCGISSLSLGLKLNNLIIIMRYAVMVSLGVSVSHFSEHTHLRHTDTHTI